MSSGLVMGRPFGIPVYVSPSWFLVAAFITFFFAPLVEQRLPGIGASRYLVAFAFAVLLYFSVFVHELSHSVVARAFGLPVRRITLYLLGGVSEIETEPQNPWREFLVAVAGPVLSLALGLLSFGLFHLLPAPTVAALLAGEVALANLLVGLFNLLPGLPLDGGRMLRAGVWKVTGRQGAATVTAAWGGRVLGVLVFAAPFVLAAVLRTRPEITLVIWSALIGSFLWMGASQALHATKMRSRLPLVSARRLARRAVPVAADLPLAEALRHAHVGHATGLVVIDRAGRPIALVNEQAVSATPERRRPWVDVGAMSRTLEPGHMLAPDLAGRDLLAAMQAHPASEYLLIDESGEIFGVLAAKDVDHAFAGK